MDYLLQANEHTHCLRKDEGPGFRLLAHPTQVPLLERCLQADRSGTEICTCNFLTCAKSNTELLEYMSTVGDRAYERAWSSGRMDALKFGFRYNQMLHRRFLNDGADITTDVAEMAKTLRHHPAVLGGLGFLFDNQFTVPVMHLLSEIYDIDRFRKPGRENSIAYLKNYFRVVTSKSIHKHLQGSNDDDLAGAIPRAAIALSTWYTHPAVRTKTCSYIYCLYQKWFNHFMLRGRTPCDAATDAAWRTTVKVLQFVFWTWVTPLHDSQTLDARLFFSDHPGIAEKFGRYTRQRETNNVKLLFGPFDLT